MTASKEVAGDTVIPVNSQVTSAATFVHENQVPPILILMVLPALGVLSRVNVTESIVVGVVALRT